MSSLQTSAIEPERPANLEPAAQWNAERRVWSVGEWDAEGRPQGRHQVYTPEGKLKSSYSYAEGQLSGPFEDYHPNGELARRGSYEAGKLDGECVRYASTQPTPERLRSCCVPSSAWSMRTRFAQGHCLFEHFYDVQERRLLADGTLYPARPEQVPEDAHFSAEGRRWSQGGFDKQGRRHGTWSYWREAGLLEERSEYEHGARHGKWEKFVAGELSWSRQYVADTLDGEVFERTSDYEDAAITQRVGRYRAGKLAGQWRLEGEQGQVLAARDLGEPCLRLELEALQGERVLALEPSLGVRLLVQLRDLGSELLSGQGASPCAAAPDDTAMPDGASAQHTALVDTAARCSVHKAKALALLAGALPPLKPAVTEAKLRSLRNAEVDVQDKLAALLDLLMCGGAPASVLRELSGCLVGTPELGLRLISVALLLEPGRVDALATRTLLYLELGLQDEAEADIHAVRAQAPEIAEYLQFELRAKLPRFEFAPHEVMLDSGVRPELPSEVAQPLLVIRTSIAQAATRLSRVRQALLAFCTQPAPSWLPPDVSDLAALQPCELVNYSFESEEDGESDTVEVKEVLELDEQCLSALLQQARREWIALCWLCWGAGLGSVAMPAALQPPGDYDRALATAFARVWRRRSLANVRHAGARAAHPGV